MGIFEIIRYSSSIPTTSLTNSRIWSIARAWYVYINDIYIVNIFRKLDWNRFFQVQYKFETHAEFDSCITFVYCRLIIRRPSSTMNRIEEKISKFWLKRIRDPESRPDLYNEVRFLRAWLLKMFGSLTLKSYWPFSKKILWIELLEIELWKAFSLHTICSDVLFLKIWMLTYKA